MSDVTNTQTGVSMSRDEIVAEVNRTGVMLVNAKGGSLLGKIRKTRSFEVEVYGTTHDGFRVSYEISWGLALDLAAKTSGRRVLV